jgi:hypothetical protein
MVVREPVLNGIYVSLEVGKVRRLIDGLEEGGVVSIEDQRTIQGKGS